MILNLFCALFSPPFLTKVLAACCLSLPSAGVSSSSLLSPFFFSPLRLFAVSSARHNPLAECWSTAQEERENEERAREREREGDGAGAPRRTHTHTHTHAVCGSTHTRARVAVALRRRTLTHQNTGGKKKDERSALHCFPLFFRETAGLFSSPSLFFFFSPQSCFLLNPSQIKAGSGVREWIDEKTLRVKKRVPFSLWQAKQKRRRDVAAAPSSICPQLRLRADSTHTHTPALSLLLLSLSLSLSPSSAVPPRWRGRKDDGGS